MLTGIFFVSSTAVASTFAGSAVAVGSGNMISATASLVSRVRSSWHQFEFKSSPWPRSLIDESKQLECRCCIRTARIADGRLDAYDERHHAVGYV